MSSKFNNIASRLNQHLQAKGDTEGLIILNSLLAAIVEEIQEHIKPSDQLRKTK